MLLITFRYKDKLSNGEWRICWCEASSLHSCIEFYGLGVDCEYEILEIKEIGENIKDIDYIKISDRLQANVM